MKLQEQLVAVLETLHTQRCVKTEQASVHVSKLRRHDDAAALHYRDEPAIERCV